MKHFSTVKGNSELKCKLLAKSICFKMYVQRKKMFFKGNSKLKTYSRDKHFLNYGKLDFLRKKSLHIFYVGAYRAANMKIPIVFSPLLVSVKFKSVELKGFKLI